MSRFGLRTGKFAAQLELFCQRTNLLDARAAAQAMASMADTNNLGDRASVNIDHTPSTENASAAARKAARKAAKKAAKAAKQAKRQGAPILKQCCICDKNEMKLFRCQIDESKEWKFVCPACWPSVSYVRILPC